MRRSFLFSIAAVLALALAGCGHGSSTPPPTGTHISITPDVVSLQPGQAVTFTVQEQDSTNTALSKQPTFTFTPGSGLTLTTPNCSVVGVTGCQVDACAGAFDSTFVNCTAGSAGFQSSVKVTGDNLSATASVFVHSKVASITVKPSSTTGCVSSGGTQNFFATALDSNGADITNTVGPFTWGTTASSVVSVDNNGLATAGSAGTAGVFASAGNTTSAPSTFNTCAVKNINFHVSGAPDTSFNTTFPTTTQPQLTADVTDTNGKSVASAGLSFTVVPAALGTFGGTTFNPLTGGTGAIVSSCQPPSCNIGLGFDTFSNPVIANVSGAVSGSIWVASTSGSALVGIAPSTNTAGTPVTLPASPNSLIVGSGQKNAYLGSSTGLMIVSLGTSNTVTTVAGAPGKVLAVDPGETRAIVANGTNVFVVTISGGQVQTLNIGGATAAAWTPDGFDAYIIAGNTVTEFSPQLSPKQFNLTSPAADVTFFASGQFAYFAESSAVTVRRPCDNLQTDTVITSGAPQRVKAAINGSVFVIDSTVSTTGVDVIAPNITSVAGCGQTATDTTSFHDFGAGLFTPTQVITTPDSNYVFAIGSSNLVGYNVAQGQAVNVALAGGAQPLSGDALLDSSSLYIGASDGMVHQLKISSGSITDAAQIDVHSAVGGNPDLVAFIQH